jgi:hypothetical protein
LIRVPYERFAGLTYFRTQRSLSIAQLTPFLISNAWVPALDILPEEMQQLRGIGSDIERR